MGLTGLVIVLILLFLVFMYFVRRNAHTPPEVVSGTKVLVCSLGGKTADVFADGDAQVYSTYYRQVDVVKGQGADALLGLIKERGHDVLHLLCELDEDGDAVCGRGARLKARDLIDACLRRDTKLLFLAADNPAENCRKFLQACGGSLDVVVTFGRSGDSFTFFLGEVLNRMAAGKTLGQAWVAIAPQGWGASDKNLPSTVARLDRGNVVLRP